MKKARQVEAKRCAVCHLPLGRWHRYSSCPAARDLALQVKEFVVDDTPSKGFVHD